MVVLAVIFVVFVLITTYALCKIASESDNKMEEIYFTEEQKDNEQIPK